jgi:hypothetical protein
LAVIQAFQIERQTALRASECARSSQRDRFEIRRVAAVQRRFERLISCKIHQADARLQNPFCVGTGLIRIKSFVSVINLRGRWDERIVSRRLYAHCERPWDSIAGCR